MRRVCFTMKGQIIKDDGSVHYDGNEYICNAEVLAEYLGSEKGEGLDDSLVFDKNRNKTEVSRWFLRRYSISDVFHLHLFKGISRPFFITICVFLFCLFVFPDFVSPNFWTKLNNLPLVIACAYIAVWAFWLYYRVKGEETKIILESSRYVRKLFFCTIIVIMICLLVFPDFTKKEFWTQWYFAPIILLGLYIELWTIWGVATVKGNKDEYRQSKNLSEARQRLIARKVKALLITLFFSLVVLASISLVVYKLFGVMSEVGPLGTGLKIGTLILQVMLIALGGYYIFKKYYPVHWLSNMHVLFPRLIASIAAAWLSLAVGNELFGSFFDSIVSWSTSIWLSVIVFVFVMYEINKMLPLETTYSKVARCFGIMAISYVISLVVGLFIINFTGERILERSDVLKNFYKHYVYSNNLKQVENKSYALISDKEHKFVDKNGIEKLQKIKTNEIRDLKGININKYKEITFVNIDDDTDDKLLLDELQHVHIVNTNHSEKDKPNHPIVTVWNISGSAKFFILRDFLIQFAFVAMFIGIFITMLFEEKSITES